MMPCYRLTACGIHRCMDAVAGLQPIGPHLDAMPDRFPLRLHVDNTNLRPVPDEPAGVGRLPTALRIEGRFLEKHVGAPRLAGDRKEFGDGRVRFQMVVADEPAGTSSKGGGEAASGDPAS